MRNKLRHFFPRCSRQLRQFNLNKKWMTSRTSNTDQWSNRSWEEDKLPDSQKGLISSNRKNINVSEQSREQTTNSTHICFRVRTNMKTWYVQSHTKLSHPPSFAVNNYWLCAVSRHTFTFLCMTSLSKCSTLTRNNTEQYFAHQNIYYDT